MICRLCEKIIKTEEPELKSRRVCRPCLPLWKPKSPNIMKMEWALRGVCPTSRGGHFRKNGTWQK